MSNANNPFFMQSIDSSIDPIQNLGQRETGQSVSSNNNHISQNAQYFIQNANVNNMNPQQYSFDQYQNRHQEQHRTFFNRQFPQQDLQLINNSQSPHNYQQYTYPQQVSQPLLISQTNQTNQQSNEQQKKYPEGIDYYKTYRYDLYNIQYRYISIESWNDIPVDESPYSYMWATPESFEPEQFSKIHMHDKQQKKKQVDFFWLIFFIVNIFISIGVFAYLTVKFIFNYDKNELEITNANSENLFEISEMRDIKVYTKGIFIAVAIGAAIGLISNIIHITYSTFAPRIYINDSIWLCILISFLCVLFLVVRGFYYAFGFPILTFFLALFFFCCMRKDMSFSASVLTVTIKLFWNFPSVILMIIFDTLFELIFGLSFSLSIFFIEITETTRYLYIFICFSFLWVSSTFGYLTYMAIAGLTSTWYFLKGSIYFPKKPVWDSFKRYFITSFGSASIAGFLLCFIKLLEFIANSDNICCNCCHTSQRYDTVPTGTIDSNEERDDHPEKAILCLLKCIAICILKILEACIPFVNQYALIYCAIFEVPFKEGCRRWAEISCHKYCNLLLNGCSIKSAMLFNRLIWTIGSISLGFSVSNYLFKEFNDYKLPFPKMSISLFAFIFTYSIFQVFTQPFSTIADSIIICFFEAPEKLKTSENDLYESMRTFYENSVEEMIQSAYP